MSDRYYSGGCSKINVEEPKCVDEDFKSKSQIDSEEAVMGKECTCKTDLCNDETSSGSMKVVSSLQCYECEAKHDKPCATEGMKKGEKVTCDEDEDTCYMEYVKGLYLNSSLLITSGKNSSFL